MEDDSFRKKNYALRKSIFDYGMGIVILGFGIFFFLAPRFRMPLAVDDTYRIIFACLCVIYGGFRIYRGYKKNYFD